MRAPDPPRGDGPESQAWLMLGLIGLALILSMTTWFSATAILPELQARFALATGTVAWLTNAVQIGFVSGALGLSLSGLADAWPTRRLAAGAAGLAAASNLSLLVVPDVFWLFAARFVTGVALAGVYPPALKLIATWFVKGRGLAMGAAVGALTLGSSAPYILKASGTHGDWHAVVAISSGAALLGALLILGFTADGPYAAPRPKPDLRRVGTVLRDPVLGLANLGYFGHMWELYALWGWFLAYTTEATRAGGSLGLSPAALTALVIGIGAFGCIAGGLFADRIGRTATTALMMALSGTCALAIGFAYDGPSWLFVAIAVVWGVSVIGDSAQFSAMTSEVSDAQSVGTALTLQVGIGFALTIVSLRLVPLLAGTIGWRWTFAMLAPGPFVGALAMVALRRRPEAKKIANGRR